MTSLIVVFIHGFKGTDETFGAFPERLQHILAETIPNASVECIVFPAYQTKGDLVEAVVKFSDWLTTLTVEKEVATGLGAGKVNIVLCGHSMGGLLSADTLREFCKSRPDPQAPLWPRIIGCIAFDTPYLGLHPGVFKNSATKAVEYAQTARAVGTSVFGALAGFGASKAAGAGSSTSPAKPASPSPAGATGWGKWAGTATYAVGGALLAGAAAGATYYKREDLGLSITWATDHMKYVGHLWDTDELNRRVDFLVNAEAREGVVFRNFYSYLPPTPLLHTSARTFIVLPKKKAPAEPYFVLARNGLASDELEAHTGMFSGKTNDGYYDLGLQTAQFIREAVNQSHGSQSTITSASLDKKISASASSISIPTSAGTSDWSNPSTSTPMNTETAVWSKSSTSASADTETSLRAKAPAEAETSPWAKASIPADTGNSEWGKEWQ
ncbi:hypothetical protein B0H11DRAFT_2010406 [Mycena galericulata]|nr:hypothetical protein B0H11DRAFT_2010406 [Mycena galericulata]